MSKQKTTWKNKQFKYRFLNDPLRIKQFKLDEKFLKRFVKSGKLLDIGCSTGEFVKYLKWHGDAYGIETNEYAKRFAKKFIKFDKNILKKKNFFDVVIFRGTIQCLDLPIYYIKKTYEILKKNGYIVFIATPNTNSILYRIKQNLPALNPSQNYYIPGCKDLSNILKNYNFKKITIEFPYLKTPYCRIVHDLYFFMLNIVSSRFYKHAFFGSMMNIAAKK